MGCSWPSFNVGLVGEREAFRVMGADEHRRSSGHDLRHQGDGGDAATFVEGRHGLVKDEEAFAAMDQPRKQGAEHADFPALTLGE